MRLSNLLRLNRFGLPGDSTPSSAPAAGQNVRVDAPRKSRKEYIAGWEAWSREAVPSGENRAEAVRRMIAWLDRNEPAEGLNLNLLRLTTLPANLPASLQRLDASINQLTSLPDNLPASLQVLYVSCNQLTSLPANLPASLQRLGANYNQLTSLPENILTLPRSCTIEIDASRLSEAVRNRLASAMNAPGYSNVRIIFNMTGLRTQQARSLPDVASAWESEAGRQPSTDWSAFQSEQHAPQFAQFLSRLRETGEYRNVITRPDFQSRVIALLHQLQDQDDDKLRATCFQLAQDAVDTCGDRVALRMVDMETVCQDKRMETGIAQGKFDDQPQAVVDYCKKQYRQQVLADAASAKIKTLNFVDEIEVMVGFIVAFSREFELATQMNTMLYPTLSNLAPEDVAETRKKLTNQPFTQTTKARYQPFFESDTQTARLNALPDYQKDPHQAQRDNQLFREFLATSPAMNALLKRKYPTEVAALQNTIEDETAQKQQEIHARLEALDPGNESEYAQRCQALQREFENVPQAVSARMRQELLSRLRLENGVSDAI